jgi:L-rhamnose mutarotase
MEIFESEEYLVKQLNLHDNLLSECANGSMDFSIFIKQYNNFYYYFALDGHESDSDELALLEKYGNRIELHKSATLEILNNVCSDEYASDPAYLKSGRFGSKTAVEKLKALVSHYKKNA